MKVTMMVVRVLRLMRVTSDDWLQVQQKHVDEEQLAKVISQKLLERPGVSFSEIASVALEHGRKQLAVKVSSL